MQKQLALIIACLAAGLSFILNKALLKLVGLQSIITISPVVEELSKTMFAYFLAADILVTHLTFGVIEASYDWMKSRGKGVTAAILSIIGHGLFGAVTLFTAQQAEIYMGLAAGIIMHLIWNAVMLRIPFRNQDGE